MAFLKDRVKVVMRRLAQTSAVMTALVAAAWAGQALLVKVGILATAAIATVLPGGAIALIALLRLLARNKERERRFAIVWEDYQRRERER